MPVLILPVSLLMCLPLWSQQTVTVSGYITDASSGETLIGANVYHPESKSGTVSNNFGFYSIKVPEGEVHLRYNYVGYLVCDTTLNISGDLSLNIRLHQAASELSEVSVVGTRQSEMKGMETGRIKMSMDDLKRAPILFGEPDLIKYAQLLPGVARGQEVLSGLIVRGGNQDENLYLLDGNPMYNIMHLFGLFSTFNPDAVKSSNLYKGSFPARFGGRLSSVLDVRMKDGDMEKTSGAVSIGLISSRFNLQGPIIKGKTSYSLSLRRTYLDLIVRPIMGVQNRKNEQGASSGGLYDKDMPGYYFYDANLKLNHKIDDRNRVFMTLYLGDDVLDVDFEEHQKASGSKPGYMIFENLSAARWGSRLASLGWSHVFGPDFFANTNIFYGAYASNITASDKEFALDETNNTYLKSGVNYGITSGIKDFGLKTDIDWIPTNQHYVRFGANVTRHFFSPNVEDRVLSGTDIPEGGNKLIKAPEGKTIVGNELSLYAEDETTWSEKFSTNIGVHASVIGVDGKQYYSAQPRLSAKYQLNPSMSLKGSYAEMCQYVHLLQTTVVSMPTDMWVPVTSKVPPMRARQYALGLYWDNGGYEASMEGYFKDLKNLIAYKDGAAVYMTNDDWQERVAIGNGRAYGAEWLIKKNEGKFTGWIAYTLSWADRIYPGGEVSRGERYPDKFDNRHKLNIVGMYSIVKNLEFSAAWSYASGNMMTLELEQYLDIDGKVAPYVEHRNNFRMPDYHRLDLGLNWYRPKKKGRMGIWNLSVYNAYMHHNSFLINVQQASKSGETRNVLRSISIFPILPSISYTYKF